MGFPHLYSYYVPSHITSLVKLVIPSGFTYAPSWLSIETNVEAHLGAFHIFTQPVCLFVCFPEAIGKGLCCA